MLAVFPNSLEKKVIGAYLFALAVSTLLFSKYAMDFTFMLLGITEVLLFFWGTSYFAKKWQKCSKKILEKKLFWYAFGIRFFWMTFSYFFFNIHTGQPFEFGSADAIGYHYGAEWLSGCDWDYIINYLFRRGKGISDSGYLFYLTIFYRIFGVNVILVRLIKCLFSSFLCILLYRIASRHFDLNTAKMTALFCMLMPNLIWYCGLHLKEIEMVFLTVFSIERADYAMHSIGKGTLKTLVMAGFSALLLFGFRTALGAVVLLSIGAAILLSTSKELPVWKKWVFGSFLAIGMALTMGQQILSEVSEVWEGRNTLQSTSMAWRAERENGNSFAKYAGKAVFAPLIFTIPFPTVVDIPGQENQQMINGGNYVKNITSFFTIFALFSLLLSGEWRKHVLPIAFICGYLVVIAFSAFAQSERFHLPALPFALMFAAYGITHINKLGLKLFKFWPYFMFAAIVGWSWFKLAGRGLI